MEGRRLSQERKAAAHARAPHNAPDAQLTPEQLRKRADNRRYRANMKKKRAALGISEPPHRKRSNGAVHEQSFPLDIIPERIPASLRERAAPRAHAASIGNFTADKLLVLELVKLFNRLLDGG